MVERYETSRNKSQHNISEDEAVMMFRKKTKVYNNYKKNVCSRYLGSHQPKKCTAYGKECHLYKKMNHFASACRQRTRVNFIEKSEESECFEVENRN